MNSATRIKLSVMMFLQYAIWSVWALMLVPHLAELKITDFSIGLIMACGGLGSMLGPFIMGQLADRYFATERVLAACHLAGGALLIAASHATAFWPIFLLMLLYCTLYFPTVGLTTSLTFRALGEEQANQFAHIRFWGTIGWLLATFLVGRYLFLSSSTTPFLKPFFDLVGEPSKREVLRIPGLISLLLGVYCFALPHTPPVPATPSATGVKRSAFIESLELMKDRSFAVLLLVSGFVAFCLYYYFQCEGRFLPAVGSDSRNVGTQMTIGQIGEMVSMALVPFMVKWIGIKRTMLLGGLSYVVMFALNVLGWPWPLVVGANILHGFCFGFFFVVALMYVDKAASTDIKASAQSLFVFVVFGLFNVVGNVGAGIIRELFNVGTKDNPVYNWPAVWAIPLAVTVLCLLGFLTQFHEEKIAQPEQKVEPDAV
jgi:nucleoside transporter